MSTLLAFPFSPRDHSGLPSRERWQWAVLGVVLIGATMSALDVSIVNIIALPTVKREFAVRLALVEWVSMAYMIVLALALPIVGRLADIFGRSLLYNIGFGIFVVGSALCGFAPGAIALILARSLQAVGAALLQANSVALITQVFRSRALGRALGTQAATQAAAMALGPFIGAMLITLAGWRFIFFVNVPIGILGGIVAHFVLPRYHPSPESQKIDYLGSTLLTAGLMGVVLTINTAQLEGWYAVPVRAELIAGLVCLAAFAVVEGKAASPVIDLSIFRRYTLAAGNVAAFLAYYVLFTVLFLLPFYFEDVLDYGTGLTGIMLTTIPFAMATLAPFAGHACDRIGSRRLVLTGSGMLMVGSLMLVFSRSTAQPSLLVVEMLILGAGLGLFTPANNRMTMAAAPRDKLGVMGGLLNMMRALGVILGIDISGMIFVAAGSARAGGRELLRAASAVAFSAKPAFMTGFHTVMVSLAGLALLCVVISYFRRNEIGLVKMPDPGESIL
jgi:EmrB/QacA subfamily drug resistance transporter